METKWERWSTGSIIIQWFRQPEQAVDYVSSSFVVGAVRRMVQWGKPLWNAVWGALNAGTGAVLAHPYAAVLIALVLLGIGRLIPIIAPAAVPLQMMAVVAILLALAVAFFTAFAVFVRRMRPQQHHMLSNVTLLSLIIKLVLILTLFQFFVASPDEGPVYHTYASTVLASLERGALPSPVVSSPYTNILAVLYFVTGTLMPAGKLLNGFFLIITAFVLYEIADALFGRRVAAVTFVLVHFTPQLTIWNLQLLRESFSILLIAMIMLSLIQFTRNSPQNRFSAVAIAIGFIFLLYRTRQYMALLLMGIFAIVLCRFMLRAPHKTLRRIVLGGVSLAIVIGVFIAVQGQFNAPNRHIQSVRYFSLDTLQGARGWILQDPATSYEPNAIIDTPQRALAFLPRALFAILFVPFPSHVTDLRTLAYFLLSTGEYLLILLAIIGTYAAIRHHLADSYPILLFIFLTFALYGLADPTIGGLVRHRMQAWVFLMLLAAKGLAHISNEYTAFQMKPWKERKRERFGVDGVAS